MLRRDKMNEMQKLAHDINEFSEILDPYEYADVYDTTIPCEKGYLDTLDLLQKGKYHILRAWLDDDFGLDPGNERKRKKLLARLDKLEKASKKQKPVVSRNAKRPVDEIMEDRSWEGTYLFDDGTIGKIVDSSSYDPDDFDGGEMIGDDFYWDGNRVLGGIYIDRYGLDGEFYQGDVFLYFEGETVKDYCDRNGEPYPIKRIPDFLYDDCEDGEFSKVRRYMKKIAQGGLSCLDSNRGTRRKRRDRSTRYSTISIGRAHTCSLTVPLDSS